MDASRALLILGGTSLLLTVLTWRPIRRLPVLGVFSFFAGWLTGELAIHQIVLQGIVASWLVSVGGLAGAAGVFGAALLVVSWVTLAEFQALAFRTGRLADAALREGLGGDYDLRIHRDRVDRLPPRIDWPRVAAAFVPRVRGVEVRRDVAYVEDGAPAQRLDVYRPAGPGPHPVLLFSHGGAWVIGHRNKQGLPLLYGAAAQGWLGVSVGYRLSPAATFPDHLIDLKRGLAWVHRNAETIGADRSLVVAAGLSAGGHLASLLALTPNDPAYQPGFEEIDTRVAGCLSFYGVYDLADRDRLWPHRAMRRVISRVVMKAEPAADPEAYDRASPLCRVGPHAPPFLVAQGTHDSLVPVEQARRFAAALREGSQEPVVYLEVPGAQHAFDVFHSVRADLALAASFRFLAWLWSRRREEADRISGGSAGGRAGTGGRSSG
jgi:acetyl esterase/lipase